jgi:WD40 repeat protein
LRNASAKNEARQARQQRQLSEEATKNAMQRRQEAEAVVELAGESAALEREGYANLIKFHSQRVESLLSAVKNIQRLQKLMANKYLPTKYYPKSPVFALDKMLGKMWQQQVLKGHKDKVRSANFSPDGQYIVTASHDRTAKICKSSGELIQTLQHQDIVNDAVFSRDGQRILTIPADNTGKIWDLSGNLINILPHDGRVNGANFSPDGKYILTVSLDKTARVWDLSGKLITTLKGHTDIVLSGIFSPSSKFIVTTSTDNTAKLWDISGIHSNSSDKIADFNGLETYYYDSDGYNLANKIHDSILTKTQTENRGIRKARFYVLRKSSVPSILVEMGFITGSRDSLKLNTPEFQNQIAKAIAEGIIDYLNQR